jgi:hypothetical protein
MKGSRQVTRREHGLEEDHHRPRRCFGIGNASTVPVYSLAAALTIALAAVGVENVPAILL